MFAFQAGQPTQENLLILSNFLGSVALIDIESNLTSGQNISLRVNIIKLRC